MVSAGAGAAERDRIRERNVAAVSAMEVCWRRLWRRREATKKEGKWCRRLVDLSGNKSRGGLLFLRSKCVVHFRSNFHGNNILKN